MPSKRCEAEGCNKWASFNLPGLKRPLYCRPHSTEGMVNVVSRQRCTYPDCPKQANFNHPGETRGLFCKEHIEEGMVDVRHKHCMHPGCPKQATCNVPGAGGGMFCGQHKLDGMVNVVLKRCAQEGCETFPSFGHPGQPGVQYCRLHKLPGMTRRTSSTTRSQQSVPPVMDTMVERCAHPGCCEPRPIYCMMHYGQHPPLDVGSDAHLGQADHLQGFANLHQAQHAELHQQQHHQLHQQQQTEVHGGEHMSQDQAQHAVPHQVMGHQLGALDNNAQLQHHMHAGMGEHGLPQAYTSADLAAWQHSIAHSGLHVPSYLGATRGEVVGSDAGVGFDHRSGVGEAGQDPGQVQYHQEPVGGPDDSSIDQVTHQHQQV